MNGEIYNHEELRKQLPNHKFWTGSDCDVIAHLVSSRSNLCHSFMGSSLVTSKNICLKNTSLEALIVKNYVWFDHVIFDIFFTSMKSMERTLWTCWMEYFPLSYLILAITALLLLVMLLGLLPSTLDGGLMVKLSV